MNARQATFVLVNCNRVFVIHSSNYFTESVKPRTEVDLVLLFSPHMVFCLMLHFRKTWTIAPLPSLKKWPWPPLAAVSTVLQDAIEQGDLLQAASWEKRCHQDIWPIPKRAWNDGCFRKPQDSHKAVSMCKGGVLLKGERETSDPLPLSKVTSLAEVQSRFSSFI